MFSGTVCLLQLSATVVVTLSNGYLFCFWGSMAVMAGSLHPHKLGFVFVIYGPAWPLNTRSKQTKQLAGSKAGSMTNECVWAGLLPTTYPLLNEILVR